ncbi:MAG: hypothetical protein ACMUEK_01325 [Sodalis sp. (in: enterobacteria)]
MLHPHQELVLGISDKRALFVAFRKKWIVISTDILVGKIHILSNISPAEFRLQIACD